MNSLGKMKVGLFLIPLFVGLTVLIVHAAGDGTKAYWVGSDGTVMARSIEDHTKYLSRYALLDVEALRDMEGLERIKFIPPNTPVAVLHDHNGRFLISVIRGELQGQTGIVLSREIRQGITQ